MAPGDRLWSRRRESHIININVLDLVGGRPPPSTTTLWKILASLGRELCYTRGDLRSLRGETFAPFGGRPSIPSGDTLAALEKTLNPIRETFAPPGGELWSPSGDLCSLPGRPLLPSGGGFCSPSCSVGASIAALPHSCCVIRLRALPGRDLEPGLASGSSKAGKCGACASE